jgi:hypothetical protein
MIYEWYFFEDCRTYSWSIFRVVGIWTHCLKTKKTTYKSKHWTEYWLNGVCGQCFRPLSQVLRFRLIWNFIIRLRLTKYTCRITFWRCLNLSFSFSLFSNFIYFISFKYKCGRRNVLSKRQVWMSIFHIINLRKNKSWTQGSWIFLIKTN